MKVTANGQTFEFPDGTPNEEIGKALEAYFSSQGQSDTDLDGMPKVPEEKGWIDKAKDWFADDFQKLRDVSSVDLEATPEEDKWKSEIDTGRLGKALGLQARTGEVLTEDTETATPEQLARLDVESGNAVSYDEALKKRTSQYREEFIDDTLDTASWLPGAGPAVKGVSQALKLGAAYAGLTGGAREINKQAFDDDVRTVADRGLDVAYAAGKDAALTYAGGKVADTVLDLGSKGYRALKGMAPTKDVAELNKAGFEAKYTQEQAEDIIDKARVMNDPVARKQAMDAELDDLYTNYPDLSPELKEIQEATIRARYSDEMVEATNKVAEKFYKKMVDKDTGIPGVSYDDILEAARKAELLAGKSTLKAGTKTIADEIENVNLAQMVQDLALKRELGEGKVLDKTLQDLVGIRDPNLYKIRQGGVRTEVDNIVESLNGKGKVDIPKDLADPLRAAANAIKVGRPDDANLMLKSFDNTFITKEFTVDKKVFDSVKQIRSDLETLNNIQQKASKELEKTANAGLKRMIVSGLTGGGGSAAYDIATGKEVDVQKSMLMALAGIGGRKAIGKISQVQINQRAKQVSKALGGKYKLDDELIKLIEEGVDVAKVISYATIRDNSENTKGGLDTVVDLGDKAAGTMLQYLFR